MLQSNCIAKLLDMEHMILQDVKKEADVLYLEVEMKRRVSECPACRTLTDRIHDYRIQHVKDSPIQGKHVIWVYRKRRYRCPCCGKRFVEKNYLLPKWHRITNRLVMHGLISFEKKRSCTDIAGDLGVSVSTVFRWLPLIDRVRPSSLPRVLSIDEFRGNTEYGKFQCILTDPVNKKILDILPTRHESRIYDYLRSFPNRNDVDFFVMDMNREYLRIAQALFPNAKIIIDRFHVSRYCTWAFENVRKRVQASLPADVRKYFKRSRKLLLARMHSLSDVNKAAVERMLVASSDLRNAYLLKEKFYDFMDSHDSSQAASRLLVFKMFAAAAALPEFDPCLKMLNNWYSFILNSFDFRFSNGFTEGVNNTIKVIKRIAYGFKSFRNFRSRIFAVLNS